MKKILIILLFLAVNSNAQELKKQKDKFQNVTSYSLADMIDLDVEDIATTSDFEINIFKIIKDDQTSYSFYIVTETDYLIKCEDDSKCIFLYNDSVTIELYTVHTNYSVFKKTLTTSFQIPITEENLSELKDAGRIEIKIYCDGATYQARFRKDDLREFKNGIKLLSKAN